MAIAYNYLRNLATKHASLGCSLCSILLNWWPCVLCPVLTWMIVKT